MTHKKRRIDQIIDHYIITLSDNIVKVKKVIDQVQSKAFKNILDVQMGIP